MWLLPFRPLAAIAAAMEHGAQKYVAYNWIEASDDWREVYSSALLRHVFAYADPTEPDFDAESGIHHLAHAGACVLILLFNASVDYPALLDEPSVAPARTCAWTPRTATEGDAG